MSLIAKTADSLRVDSMRTRPKLYAATVLAFLACAMAQAQQYSFQYYGVDQGLTDLAVRSLFQDSRGFIWLSTENGIFRYDGARFEQVGEAQGLPPSNAAMFGEAPDGRLLVGGSFGLYIQTENRFESMPMPQAKEVNWGTGIQSDGKGRTYIATDAGLMAMTAMTKVAKVTNEPGAGPFQFRLVPAPAHAGNSAANSV